MAIGKWKRGKSDGDTLMFDHKSPFLHLLISSSLVHINAETRFMPLSFRDVTMQPIPKASLSTNYCGITLASSLSEVMEWSTFLTWESFFTTSDLHFGFKSGFSITLCTGLLNAVINHYLTSGSILYACLIDASKAFDLVGHRIRFDKLLERGTPKPVVCLLLHWYKSQQL